MTKAKIMKLKSGDIVTVKEQQKSYGGTRYAIDIYPGDRIRVNNSDTPHVFRIPGNDSGFLSGYVLDAQGKEKECCGVKWANVAEL